MDLPNFTLAQCLTVQAAFTGFGAAVNVRTGAVVFVSSDFMDDGGIAKCVKHIEPVSKDSIYYEEGSQLMYQCMDADSIPDHEKAEWSLILTEVSNCSPNFGGDGEVTLEDGGMVEFGDAKLRDRIFNYFDLKLDNYELTTSAFNLLHVALKFPVPKEGVRLKKTINLSDFTIEDLLKKTSKEGTAYDKAYVESMRKKYKMTSLKTIAETLKKPTKKTATKKSKATTTKKKAKKK